MTTEQILNALETHANQHKLFELCIILKAGPKQTINLDARDVLEFVEKIREKESYQTLHD